MSAATYGQVAFRAFRRLESQAEIDRRWREMRDDERADWDKAARAAILAHADNHAAEKSCSTDDEAIERTSSLEFAREPTTIRGDGLGGCDTCRLHAHAKEAGR